MDTGERQTRPPALPCGLLAARLRALITEGRLRPGMKLPSEAELVRQYGLGRNMVRRALTMLAEEQLIDPVPGRGWFVS